MKNLKLQDYIIVDTQFEFGVFKIYNRTQLDQATSDDQIKKFLGTSEQADEIISLQNMLHRLLRTNEDNVQRCEQVKSNINMMINKYKGL